MITDLYNNLLHSFYVPKKFSTTIITHLYCILLMAFYVQTELSILNAVLYKVREKFAKKVQGSKISLKKYILQIC
jgi:hypothetical protein